MAKLHVNKSAGEGALQVNITTQVNSAKIRRVTYNEREHLVLPSWTLPSNVVMNDVLYLESEIDAHYRELEGTLAPLGHPTVNGKHVSAFSPEGINQGHVGAWNRNVKKVGNRVYLEKWIDVEVARARPGGVELIDRIEALERGEDVPPIHTSVAVFLERIPATDAEKSQGSYSYVAKIYGMDHDAILLHEVGAATPEQGVGLMVNADEAKSAVVTNRGILRGVSYRDKEQILERAARDKFATGEDEYAWVADFTDDQVIVVKSGDAQMYGYRIEDGNVIFDEAGTPVERQESWVSRIPVVNWLMGMLKIDSNQPRLKTNQEEREMPLTKEERAELVQEVTQALQVNFSEALKPLQGLGEKLADIEAQQKALADSLTANQRAEETAKREAVAKVHGEIVANQLSGEALDSMYKSLGKSKGLSVGDLETNSADKSGVPDFNTYIPEGE